MVLINHLELGNLEFGYKVYADIRGAFTNVYENFRQTHVYLSSYVFLVTCLKY